MLRLLATLLFCVLVLESNPVRSDAGVFSDKLEATFQLGEASTASSVFFAKNIVQWPEGTLISTKVGGATIRNQKDKLISQFERKVVQSEMPHFDNSAECRNGDEHA